MDSQYEGQIKGDTQKERVANWFNHFRNLLGSAPEIENREITI